MLAYFVLPLSSTVRYMPGYGLTSFVLLSLLRDILYDIRCKVQAYLV